MKPAVTRLPALSVWLLIAAVAFSMAYWTWRLAPLPGGGGGLSLGPDARFDAAGLKNQNWFSASAGAKSASGGRYTLRWLYPGRPGVCILGMPGLQDQTFRVGDEIEPGVKLKEVGKDYVLIQGARGTERIELPERQEVRLSASVPPPPNLHIEPDAEKR
jgi:hypothetical protein